MLRFFLLINAPWTMLASIIKGFITISMKWKKNYLIYQTPKMYDKYWNVFLCHFIQYSIKSCFWWMVYITAWFESSKYINSLQKNLNISILTHTKTKVLQNIFLHLHCTPKNVHIFMHFLKFANLLHLWKKPLNKSECQIYFEKF